MRRLIACGHCPRPLKGLALGLLLTAVVCAQAASPPQAAGAGSIDTVRRLASTGAVDLALDRIDRDQPKQPGVPAWVDWESLRLELLARRGRDADVLARIKTYPEVVLSGRSYVGLLAAAARAAQRSGEPAEARRQLARLFLVPESTNAEYRSARLAVIDAYLAEGDAEAAYRSMLRFQQDFNPLRSEEAEHFVAGLVEAERITEAATWLARLEPSSPWSALLRMRAGLLSPEKAVAQARTAIAKGGGEAAWALLAAAGRALADRVLAVEVAEHRLNTEHPAPPRMDRADPGTALWRLYSEAAQQSANQAQLLSGDDAAWLKHAALTLKTQPPLARALLAHLARNSASARIRAEAQLGLLAALREAKLVRAALRLFSDGQRFSAEAIDARVRYELGAAALDAGQAELAVRYWRGLAPPAGMSGAQWQVLYCSALMRAGRADEAFTIADKLLAGAPAPDVLRPLIDVASYALTISQARAAQAMLTTLLPLVADSDRAAVLAVLARAHELSSEYRAAAAAYLDAAAGAATPESDRESLRAREAGASNLLKAGLRDDARAVYEWLARNAKDAAVKDAAARMLKALR